MSSLKKQLIIILLLAIIGLIYIYSASSFTGLMRYNDSFYFFKKELIGYLIAFPLAFLIISIDPNFFLKYSIFFYVAALITCLFTFIPKIGIAMNGARRWFYTPFMNIQPIEILKPIYCLACAKIISIYRHHSKGAVIGILILLFPAAIILLKQPDFGQLIILAIATAVMFISVKPKKEVFYISAILGVAVLAFLAIARPYRIRRILTFLDPWKDPKGSGFQIIQSLIAINTGGFWGLGIGQSNQKMSCLPMQHTDFIFSIICEESGIIVGILVMFLFLLLFNQILNNAIKIAEVNLESSLALIGLGTMIAGQAFFNIFVATGTVPTKGIGLPFISYGASSIVGVGLALGLIFALQNAYSEKDY
jgi:cell division protein FtsW